METKDRNGKISQPDTGSVKENLTNYVKQLTSISNLQQAILIKLQKEIKNIR